MPLNDEIDNMRKEIRTDGYGMSIGEWISLYENKEIDIHPEFQRFYRWSEIQKSNLIESILLGIPIPPIFVSQRKEGVWDVIDGLQRLSTLYQFVGVLKDENGNNVEPLKLEKTKYLPSLEGKKWNDPYNPDNSFTSEQRLLIKRAKIDVSIVLRESDQIAKYELFQRLNTGGANLTPQEVRNCIMVMIKPDFHKWIKSLSSHKSYQECIALSDKNLEEQYDIELALRFIIFSTLDLDQYDRSKDVGEYLTDRMVEMAQDNHFDEQSAEARFRETFDHLKVALGSNAFRRYSDGQFKGGFLLSPFEVVAFGLGFNHPDFPSPEETTERTQQLYLDATYQQWSGSGVRANSRLPHLIPLGRDIFRP
ncbi:MAG: DUF262 domain-containing protein [Deltaproteobacteria bacterium]|nr:DUF262 domain-containing protein [Deltaproteobacteria bacterium]